MSQQEPRIDFSYTFATPHLMTVAMPDSSDKTLLDSETGSLKLAWSYDDLTRYPLGSFKIPPVEWELIVEPRLDGKAFTRSTWTRLERFLPMLDNVYEDAQGTMRLLVAGAKSAALVRIEMTNAGKVPHCFSLVCSSVGSANWAYNPASVEEYEYRDTMLTGSHGRPDRIMIFGLDADEYGTDLPHINKLIMTWNLQPGEVRTGWIVRPYESYKVDLPSLRTCDWTQEFEHAKQEWHALVSRASEVTIPDPAIRDAFYACLSDLFIMREPVADGYIAGIAGTTEGARSANDGEPAVVAVALDQLGYHREAEEGFRMNLDQQGEDGDWATPKGWSHHFWAATGYKAWAAMEHYRLTKDREYLNRIFPRMLASARFQESRRKTTRKMDGGKRPLTYGLMPPGNGDAGLPLTKNPFGVYLTHNTKSVHADACAVEAAETLGKTEELAELRQIYQQALGDLMEAFEHGAISEEGYRWIPGTAGERGGSRWGALFSVFPCRLLPADHELISGTIRKIESDMSPGGLPLATGWMKDGIWPAIALDELAEAHLIRGNGDKVAEYLYAVLNHGTPLYTWCEERGQEAGSERFSGDRHHLFTPVSVVRLIRDLLVMEDQDGLQLARGTARSWLASGKPMGITDARTYFGPVSYRIQYDAETAKAVGHVNFHSSSASWAKLYLRLPGGLRVKSVAPETRATVLPDESALYFEAPRGEYEIEANIGT